MADEIVETSETVETPDHPEPTVEELRAQLAEERARNGLYKDTLAALGRTTESTPPAAPSHSPTPSVASAPPDDKQLAKQLAEKYGYDEGQVASYLPLIRDILRLEAGPAIQTLFGVADRTAQLEARLTIDDWKTIEKEATKVAREYRERGVVLNYNDAATIARARLGPQAQTVHDTEATDAARGRSNAARLATGSAPAVQKPGPSPSKQPHKRLTREEIDRMPRGPEKEKALEDALGDSII